MGTEGHLCHQLSPAIHVIGIVMWPDHVFCKVEDLGGVSLQVTGVDAA